MSPLAGAHATDCSETQGGRMGKPTTIVSATTRVINITSGATFTVYIGRYHRSSHYGILPRSRWANPFRIGKEATDASDAVEQYRSWLPTQPQLMGAIPSLRGHALGCWCAPEPCHGDVLAELADEERSDDG